MALNLSVLGSVRTTSPAAYSSGEQQVEMNSRGDLCVTQSLPPYAELTRLGNRWSVIIATGSAFQPVAAWPTTLANIVLYNGDTTKSYVIDAVYASAITSIAAATSFTLLGQISNAGVAAPAQDTAQLITGSSGETYGGSAKRAVANTAFAVANKWSVLGVSNGAPSTAIGSGAYADVSGRYIVPPGACFCVNVVASTAGGTMVQGIDWYEVTLDLP